MNFKVEFWDDEESRLHTRWLDSIRDAMTYIEGLKKQKKITSITLSQVLYQFEA